VPFATLTSRAPRALLTLAVAAWVLHFTRISMLRHYAYWDSAYDVGIFDQGVWLLSRGHNPFVTVMGRHLFGDHSSFILLLLVPFYWVAGIEVLYLAQSACIAFGAVFVFRFALSLFQDLSVQDLNDGSSAKSEWSALACALAFLAHPALGWANLENFHPDSALALFLPAVVFYGYERRWRMFWLFAVLALLTKEDVSLVLLPIGVWFYFANRRDENRESRFHGALLATASIVTTLTMMFVVMRSLMGVPTRNGWRIPFGGISGFFKTLFTNPRDVAAHFWSDDRPLYILKMLLPTAFVFLASPSLALAAFVVLSTNILSTFWYQYQVEYHYALVAVPALVMGSVWAIARFKRAAIRRVALVALLAASVTTSFTYGTFAPSKDHTPPAYYPYATDAEALVRQVPDGAPVSVAHNVTTHLNHRKEVYMFPTPFSAKLFGVGTEWEGKRLEAADRIEWVLIPITLEADEAGVWEREQHAFKLVDANDHWRLFRRVTAGR
jgi:uncharacterized membrane protein